MNESYYDLLEVSTNASFEEIESSYQRIVSYLDTSSLAIYSMMEDDEVARMRSAVDEAYRTLSDPERRAAYDRALSEGDGYFPVMIPDVQTDSSSISMGHVERREERREERRDERRELERLPPSPRAESAPTPPPEAEPEPEPVRRAPSKPARRLKAAMDVDIGPDTEFSGSFLRRLRESADATLEELGEITKISKRYLHAIEENDFSALPAAVYVRGFVSEYARALGLDSQAVAKSYMALYQRYKTKEGS